MLVAANQKTINENAYDSNVIEDHTSMSLESNKFFTPPFKVSSLCLTHLTNGESTVLVESYNQ